MCVGGGGGMTHPNFCQKNQKIQAKVVIWTRSGLVRPVKISSGYSFMLIYVLRLRKRVCTTYGLNARHIKFRKILEGYNVQGNEAGHPPSNKKK